MHTGTDPCGHRQVRRDAPRVARARQSGKIDLAYMFDATEERKAAVAFPDTPLLHHSLAVLARGDLEVEAWSDLDDPSVRVAVLQASSMDKYVGEFAPSADIQRFPGNREAIAAFQAGRVDAASPFHPPLPGTGSTRGLLSRTGDAVALGRAHDGALGDTRRGRVRER